MLERKVGEKISAQDFTVRLTQKQIDHDLLHSRVEEIREPLIRREDVVEVMGGNGVEPGIKIGRSNLGAVLFERTNGDYHGTTLEIPAVDPIS